MFLVTRLVFSLMSCRTRRLCRPACCWAGGLDQNSAARRLFCTHPAFVAHAQAIKAEGGEGEEASTGMVTRQAWSRSGGARAAQRKVLQMESALRTLDSQVMEELTMQQADPARARSSSLEHNRALHASS